MDNLFISDGAMGDSIYSLPTVITFGGGCYKFTKYNQYDFLRTLLLSQPYILDVYWYDIHNKYLNEYDLRQYRKITKADPTLHLALCHAKIFNVKINISDKWLFGIEPKRIDNLDIIVNVSPRYHTDPISIDYKILKDYENKILFVGKNSEFKNFYTNYDIKCEHYKCINALEIAQIIAGCKLFIGNQSLCFAVAEALKSNRVLEIYNKKPNCTPQSANGHTILNKELIEKYLNQINER